jgi:zinc transport system substrate-binding protein
MHEIILCKLGEVVLKGLNRHSFETKLMSNIRRRTSRFGRFKIYSRQSTIYVEPLEDTCDLDGAYAAGVAAAPRKTLILADRFPFRYLAADYGLTCYAAFPGCSAETGASFSTVVELARRAEEAGVTAILQLESADGSLAAAVRDATKTKDQKILTLNSLQSARSDADYLSVMEDNLTVLQEALA